MTDMASSDYIWNAYIGFLFPNQLFRKSMQMSKALFWYTSKSTFSVKNGVFLSNTPIIRPLPSVFIDSFENYGLIQNSCQPTARSHPNHFLDWISPFEQKVIFGQSSHVLYLLHWLRPRVVLDNSPRTYPRTNPKHDLGVD